jgi:uncharacterized protein (TIGR02284 family)
MLRTDQELALDDVTEASKYAVDQFEKLAEMPQEPTLCDLIKDFGNAHRRHVSRLEETVRRMGNLPSAPDPDREAFSRLATRVKAALAEDRDRVVAESCSEIETRIIDAVHQARKKDLLDDIRSLLADIGEDCGKMLQRLEDYLQP